MKPSTRKLTAFAAVAVMALGSAGAAQARHGADDPAGHTRGADDVQPHVKHHRHHHHHHHHRGGADDGPNHR